MKHSFIYLYYALVKVNLITLNVTNLLRVIDYFCRKQYIRDLMWNIWWFYALIYFKKMMGKWHKYDFYYL